MSAPAATQNGDAELAPPRRRFARPGTSPATGGSSGGGPSRILAGGTAAIALISALVALGFSLKPDWKPDPRDAIGAHATVLAVERKVTVANWLRRISPPGELKARRREWIEQSGTTAIAGELAYVRLSVRGFKRRKVDLRWAVYEQRTQRRLRGAGAGSQANRSTTVVLEAPTDELVVEQWLLPVDAPDEYFVRFEVRSPQGTLLDVADSEPFKGI